MPFKRGLFACLCLVAACAPIPRPAPEATPGRFYTGREYGSESQFNPISQVVSVGYDMFRTRDADRRVFQRDYAGAFRNVMQSVLHADRTYRTYGVERAMRNEWLPLTLRNGKGGGAWIGNYEFHTLGDGLASVRLEEWYAQHGSGHPRIAAISTIMAGHLLNEVVENGATRMPNEDATTDLLIFDPLGIMLWRIDAVQRLFTGPLEMTTWTGQPSLDVHNGTLHNESQQFMVRGRVPGTQRWRVLYDIGLSNLLGLSYGRKGGDALSVALGPYVVSNPVVDTVNNVKTATFRMNGGVFYDRDGSLLFSAIYSARSEVTRLNVNVYPGVLRVGTVSPGVWLHTVPGGGIRVGVVSRFGVGIGLGRNR